MKETKSVKVVIGGDVYDLESDGNPEHLHSVAAYIDGKIKAIHKQQNSIYINTKLKSMFLALNIADDLFKERQLSVDIKKERVELNESLSDYMDENAKLVQENALLKEKIVQLEKEMIDVKQELRQFLENF